MEIQHPAVKKKRERFKGNWRPVVYPVWWKGFLTWKKPSRRWAPNLAVYHSQQPCEFFSKAYLAIEGIEEIKVHSPSRRMYRELSKEEQNQFRDLLKKITELESLYIPSRYDEEVEGKIRVPALEFGQEEKNQSIRVARSCQKFCINLIQSRLGRKLPGEKGKLLNELKGKYSDVINLEEGEV